jgi:hypothetical protein
VQKTLRFTGNSREEKLEEKKPIKGCGKVKERETSTRTEEKEREMERQ